MKIHLNIKKELEVKYLKVDAGVRYWEDATVNDIVDTKGSLIPFKKNNRWQPLIDLDKGVIVNWSKDKKANIHYKVCDGTYSLLDENKVEILSKDCYVPDILSPTEDGQGDYIILQIDYEGKIYGWNSDLIQEYLNEN